MDTAWIHLAPSLSCPLCSDSVPNNIAVVCEEDDRSCDWSHSWKKWWPGRRPSDRTTVVADQPTRMPYDVLALHADGAGDHTRLEFLKITSHRHSAPRIFADIKGWYIVGTTRDLVDIHISALQIICAIVVFLFQPRRPIGLAANAMPWHRHRQIFDLLVVEAAFGAAQFAIVCHFPVLA